MDSSSVISSVENGVEVDCLHDKTAAIEGAESCESESEYHSLEKLNMEAPIDDVPTGEEDFTETMQEFDFLEDDDCFSDACSRNSDIQAIEITFATSSSEDDDPFNIRGGVEIDGAAVESEVVFQHDMLEKMSAVSTDEDKLCFANVKKLCLEELKRFSHGDSNRFSTEGSCDKLKTSFSDELDNSLIEKINSSELNESRISFSEELISFELDDSNNLTSEEPENPLLAKLIELECKDSKSISPVKIKLTKSASFDLADTLKEPESEETKKRGRKKAKRSPSLKITTSLCRSITDLTKLGSNGFGNEKEAVFSPSQIRKMLSSTFSSPKSGPRRHVQSLYSPSHASEESIQCDNITTEDSPKSEKKSPLFERLTNWDGFRKRGKAGDPRHNTISDPGRVKRRASLGAFIAPPLYEEQHFHQLETKRELKQLCVEILYKT